MEGDRARKLGAHFGFDGVDRGGPERRDRAELSQETARGLLTHAGDLGQLRDERALCAQRSMIRDREPMGLVADALNEMKDRRRVLETDRFGLAGQEDELLTLRYRGERERG